MSYFVELLAEIASFLAMTIAVASPDGNGISPSASVTLVPIKKLKYWELDNSTTYHITKKAPKLELFLYQDLRLFTQIHFSS